MTAAARVSDGNTANSCQVNDERFVDAGLFALDVCGVDQEFAAVGFEESDVLCVC